MKQQLLKPVIATIGILLCCLPIAARSNDVFNGKVTSVIDGNTVELQAPGNSTMKVVLFGIDSPEIGQEFGEEAKKYLEKILLKKEVSVKIQGKDRKGNYLGIITVGDDDARIELLKQGLAWTEEKNPNPELEPYRTWAQQKGKGLWKMGNPTPPWIYRRQQSMLQPKTS